MPRLCISLVAGGPQPVSRMSSVRRWVIITRSDSIFHGILVDHYKSVVLRRKGDGFSTAKKKLEKNMSPYSHRCACCWPSVDGCQDINSSVMTKFVSRKYTGPALKVLSAASRNLILPRNSFESISGVHPPLHGSMSTRYRIKSPILVQIMMSASDQICQRCLIQGRDSRSLFFSVGHAAGLKISADHTQSTFGRLYRICDANYRSDPIRLGYMW